MTWLGLVRSLTKTLFPASAGSLTIEDRQLTLLWSHVLGDFGERVSIGKEIDKQQACGAKVLDKIK